MATLGNILSEARARAGINLSNAAAATRLKTQMIEALERDDFSKIPATIYGKGFIKIYAEYLGLDPAPLIEEYLSKVGPPKAPSLMGDPSKTIQHPKVQVDGEEAASGQENPPDVVMQSGMEAGNGTEPPEAGAIVRIAAVVAGITIAVILVVWLVGGSRDKAPDGAGKPVSADPAAELPVPYFSTTAR